ncbi:MAG: hypothetical protein J6B09_05045, partial [Clostridia bacterium]|nr:hypothetical protein [Clostridia bacterium]
MNSPKASNWRFCGGNAADLQSKLPKSLSEQAKARSDSDEGISDGYTIALVRKVTFAKIKPSKLHARPQNALRFARESAQFVARFHSFDSANTAPWCLLR